jgi:hypothetical protein
MRVACLESALRLLECLVSKNTSLWLFDIVVSENKVSVLYIIYVVCSNYIKRCAKVLWNPDGTASK